MNTKYTYHILLSHVQSYDQYGGGDVVYVQRSICEVGVCWEEGRVLGGRMEEL